MSANGAVETLAPPVGVSVEDTGEEEVSSLLESVNFADLPGAVPPPPPPGSQPPQSPFITRQTACLVSGVHTDIVVQSFADRIFVTITQTKKVGTMLYASSEKNPKGELVFDVKVPMQEKNVQRAVVCKSISLLRRNIESTPRCFSAAVTTRCLYSMPASSSNRLGIPHQCTQLILIFPSSIGCVT